MMPPPADPAPAVTVSRCGAAENAAVTAVVTLLTDCTTQLDPVHAPLKPSKLPLFVLPPISVTLTPASNVELQMPLVTPAEIVHAMPDGELVTLPVPVPLPLTAMMPAGGTRYVTSATRAWVIVT
jgi:hypothetical protein